MRIFTRVSESASSYYTFSTFALEVSSHLEAGVFKRLKIKLCDASILFNRQKKL